MKYQLLVRTDDAERSGAEERTTLPAGQLNGGPAGTAGLQWLWGMVELRLSQPEPDTAA